MKSRDPPQPPGGFHKIVFLLQATKEGLHAEKFGAEMSGGEEAEPKGIVQANWKWAVTGRRKTRNLVRKLLKLR